MSKRLTGLNPLAYIGVEPSEPSNTIMSPDSPTPTDVRNVNIGDFWINTTTLTLYVLMSQQGGVATWVPLSAGGGATTTFTADSGMATEFGGNVFLLGDGTNTTTSASGDAVTFALSPDLILDGLRLTGIGIEGVVQADASGNLFATNGTSGQILIGGGTAPQWATLTEGSNIAIVNGPNSITISASGAGGGGAVNFLTDSGGPATETGGDITFAGGSNITTDGSVPNTVTLNLSGTTNHRVQVGNAGGSLTSLGAGLDGEVLIGSTGANPTFAALTSPDGSITFTQGPGTLALQALGGGGGSGTITTVYDTPGSYTWTKNLNTSYVEVMGWCAGGGGGSGGSANLAGQRQGGAGGGSGSFFRFRAPEAFFGATEPVEVGAGGIGGSPVTATVGNDGTEGGVSSFGNIIVPLTTNNIVANATVSQLPQFGAGGGSTSQITPACGFSGGIFADDGSMVYNSTNTNFQYGVPHPNTIPGTFGSRIHGGGAGSFDVGADGLSIGGLAPYGLPSRGSFGFAFMLGTSGGQGGSISQTLNYYNGGKGGDVNGFDTTTVLSAGGTIGVAGGAVDGGNGNDQPTSGGLIFGGTGGGGGAADPNLGGDGGNGGFPGGGGGGGGSCSVGKPTGAGGNGGDGMVIVIEYI